MPDHFYTSLDRHVDFTIEEFIPYRIEIDNGMRWVRRMEEIIEDTPLPRRCRDMLPPRPLPLEKDRVGDDESDEDEEEEGYRTSDEGEGAQHSQVNLHSTNLLPVNATRKRTIDRLEKKRATKKAKLAAKANKKAAKKTKKSKEQAEEKKHSRQQYRDVMVRGHRRFFYSVMAQCAIRGRGLLIELARNGRSGDFGFCRYRWTQSERAAFLQHSRVPAAVHDLAAATPLVCIFYYCRHRESWFTGPKIAPKHYERLDMLLQNSIIFWDISGPDVVIREEASETSTQNDTNERPILAIVPSEDVQPTQKQRSSIEASMRKPQDDWEKHTPSISSMLNTGRFLTEYCMPRTPLDAGCDWSAIWEFLDNLTTVSNFQYPAGHDRDSKTYRHTLQAVNQELAQYWDDLKQTGGHDDEADDVEVHASDVSDQDGS